MAQRNTSGFSDQFDLEQMLVEAQHRWLRTPEICEILRNHKRFNVAPEPPNMPPSGSLFLFDRKVLRYFRKDGHRWRKKKDAKTVKEAHERLKAGSIDVLHCYYAHGEENENFQRRSYWLLEEELSHIVLVHYREVKGSRTNFNRFKETEQAISNATKIQQIACNSEAESSINSGIKQINRQLLCQNAESRSLNSGLSLDYEHVETDSYQTKSPAVSSLEIDEDNSLQKHKKELDLWEWEDSLQSHSVSAQAASVNHSMYKVSGEDAMPLGFPCKLKDTIMPKLHDYLVTDNICLDGHTMDAMDHLRNRPSVSACLEDQSDVESNLTIREKSGNSSAARTLLDRPVKDEVLTESDSFSQWICKELGYMEPGMPSSVAYRAADDKISDYTIHSPKAYSDSYTLGPSLSQERLFRIIDFAPNWGYADSETKVLITGKFLEAQQDAGKHQFSCMFGEMEVPAEVIADGVLRCYAPPHDVARVHFFVTCANRVACSEVREFEYRDKFIHRFDVASLGNNPDALQIRFCKLLSLGSRRHRSSMHCNLDGSSDSHHEITSLLKGIGSEWFQILELTSKEFSLVEVKDRLGEKFLKAKLCEWLLCKEAEGDDSLRVLNENGQGVLHLAAALGYDWAISPIVAAGVSINFRDVCGWTALHFAAYYGRERTIAYLISMGAFAGALTDPTPTYPMGRTSADLASDNGHKGIAGFLAESALSAHLECLALVDSNKQDNVIEPCGITSVLTVSERVPTPVSVSEDTLDGLSLKDSLAALCNATQAAAQIHQIFRLHSFKRKQIKECGNNKIETSDEYDVSILALKTQKQGQREGHVHAAAIKIQDKFRSWKGRRDFVRLRQKIVKIQAHFRGHQVRKHYKAFVWSVGILEKVILRWRRKRSGLRGFRSVSSTVKSQSDSMSSKEDDYDFLKQGRKQSEERLQKALSRVKSMVRHPEARDQYRRLLTTMGEIKELKDGYSSAMDRPDASASMDDDMVDIDALLNGGTMPYEIAKRHLYVTD